MTSRNLDYRPLTRRVGLRARLAALAGNPLMVMGTTLGALLAGVPVIVVAVQLATGGLEGFGWFCLFFLLPCGLWVLADALGKSGQDGRLGAFARANRLELVQGVSATHYSGSLFADGSHVVRQSVRTPGHSFVEVGERWPVTTPRISTNPATGVMTAAGRTPEVFLRARLAGRVGDDASVETMVTPELDDALRRFAGAYRVEATGRELTLFGTGRLDAAEPGRMEEAFELADRLVEAANTHLVSGSIEKPTLSGVRIPDRDDGKAPQRRAMGPLKVVGLTLALMVIGPLLIAAVMSVADDGLRGNEGAARLVVGLVVVASLVVVGWVVGLITKPQGRPRPLRSVLIGVAVVAGTIGILAWAIAHDDDGNTSPEAAATSCADDDYWCRQEQRTAAFDSWARGNALRRLAPSMGCVDETSSRTTCVVTATCPHGRGVSFDAVFAKDDAVVGVRRSFRRESLAVSRPAVARFVDRLCSRG